MGIDRTVRRVRAVKRGVCAALLASWLLHSPCEAYRPLATEDAGVAVSGAVELEASWDLVVRENGSLEHSFLLVPARGFGSRLELSAEVPYLVRDPGASHGIAGLGDICLVSKWLLTEARGPVPAVALKGAMKTRSGCAWRGTGSGERDYALYGIASRTCGSWTLHAMSGYVLLGTYVPGRRTVAQVSAALDRAMGRGMHLMTEAMLQQDPDPRVPAAVNGLVGVARTVREGVTWDAAVRLRVRGEGAPWSTAMGLAVAF